MNTEFQISNVQVGFVGIFFQILNPFYIFQIVSVSLWYADNYYIFATCIVVISAISLSVELFETRKVMELQTVFFYNCQPISFVLHE